MKKTFKGFTLVECLVSMAILAVAGTLMAEIYAAVATRNNFNHFNNSSLANQMAYVEKYMDAETLTIPSAHTGTTPPSGNNAGTNAYVKIKNTTTNFEYSFPVDIHILYSRDTQNRGSNDGSYSQGVAGSNDNWELVDSGKVDPITHDKIMIWQQKSDNSGGRVGNDNEHNLRYKYLLGHTS